MMRSILVFGLILGLTACIDPIRFDTGSESRRLVVDGFITNISYQDRLDMPATPERFYVALRWTSEVGNDRDEVITHAFVQLISSENDTIPYYWDHDRQRFTMYDDEFSAREGVEYKIRVIMG